MEMRVRKWLKLVTLCSTFLLILLVLWPHYTCACGDEKVAKPILFYIFEAAVSFIKGQF
jgi:hypothetical protein